ncbi:hypothetical protein LR48_Vigan01g330700 [Vigna angularis]|uniref:Uncharacterized protein n=2 Tax=Phaseolus angularis TaxID=3914 RepID=A0A0L9TTC3_PHAAN|nr:uncharacterized protein LOC108338058 [Vigna angularis]KAG2390406.1 uncharacterized protein HKW66_Vig0221880 [Vigna angularis]KOM33751.1 hypothetical protein LR48_Vigan01g330700 [Vigna angularis]BAT82701.1 hypothetical protein VIGAN_03275400 [Vigna angularis var. angularis]
MEVVIQSPSSPTMDNFDFGSNMGSIYHSVPSSPKGFGNYFLSAPTSPSRLSQLYSEFEYFSSAATSSFEAAADKIHDEDDDDDKDDYSFAFSVSRESDKSSRSAEELFDGGKIKPLNESRDSKDPKSEERRGRGKEKLPSSSSNRRVTRSHSPYRWEAEKQQLQQQPKSNKEESSVLSSSSSSKGGSKRWWLTDLLLFRSASEGRGSGKDPLKKYYKKNGNEEVKGSSSFRSSDSSRRKGQVSAHELHYAMKRAESKDMKKRTFLPYRQGILGRLAGFGI